jgi:hypothetical protein
LQLPSKGTETLIVRAIALKSGWLFFPRFTVLWEKNNSASIELVDSGEKDVERRMVFVEPSVF